MQTLNGVVKSNKMTKAIIVQVDFTKTNVKYNKKYKAKKNYSVACEDSSKFAIGDSVTITSCKPVSKNIKFKVVN